MRRGLLAGFIGTLVFLLPGVTATAADDPGPRQWPTVQESSTSGGTTDDPAPVKWPDISQPDVGSASDPKPQQWPAPEQG